jgi:hypothetical protein
MNAKQTFENFGFEQTLDDRYMIEYSMTRIYDKELKVVITDTIQFFKILGTFVIIHSNNGKVTSQITITMDLYACIHAQLDELGWIE